jgi:hypothetical protein
MKLRPVISAAPVRPHGPTEIAAGVQVTLSGAEAAGLFRRLCRWVATITAKLTDR